MFFWFLGLGLVSVAIVFASPALDYRMVMLGAVLPIIEVPFGEPRVLHSLAGSVVVLTVVMLATRGQRLRRRRLLGIPIGMFMHLVLDGVWADTEAFWWPFLGLDFSEATIPEIGRGWLNLGFEAVGLATLFWARRAFGLEDPQAWEVFKTTGRLPRDLSARR